MPGRTAQGSLDTDSKRDSDIVSVVFPVKPAVVPVTIVTTNHVAILLVTHVLIGLDGLNGQVVRLHVVLVSEENNELAMVAILKKVTIAMAPTISPNPV